ncbi:MAG: hypothetical protein U0869_06085 [Chloroflexota bacterium]
MPKADRAARGAALDAVRLDCALLRRYPHQLSGARRSGCRWRSPWRCVRGAHPRRRGDERLDVTVQAEVAELFRRLRAEEGTAVLLVSHDLALVAGSPTGSASSIGWIVERGGPEVLLSPASPVTQALVAANPSLLEADR